MDFQHLTTFVAIAETGNLRKASRRLHLSQSAVSTQLKLLEEEFGIQLFVRSAKGMALTGAGEKLLPKTRELLEEMKALRNLAAKLGTAMPTPLRIGVVGDSGRLRIGRLSRLLREKFPGIECYFIATESRRVVRELMEDRFDLSFFYGEIEDRADITREEISKVAFRIVIPTTLAPQEQLDWQELAELPWILSDEKCPAFDLVRREMVSKRLQPRRVVDAREESIIRELILAGEGVGIIREDEAFSLERQQVCRVWKENRFELVLGLACSRRKRLDPPYHEVFGITKNELFGRT